MGMSLFFALSGFLITKNLLAGQSPGDFFVRRLTRILPLAYAYLIFVFLIYTCEPKTLFVNLFFCRKLCHGLSDPGRSLLVARGVESFISYLAIGLIVWLLGKRGIFLVVPLCLTVTLLRMFEGATIDIKTHLRVDEILSGACVALLYEYGLLKWKLGPRSFAIAVFFWFVASEPYSGWLQYVRPYSSAMVLATTLTLREGLLFSILASRPARYVAEISYALYVIHPLTVLGMDEMKVRRFNAIC